MNIIATDRLILTPHGLTDFDEFHAMWADPQTVRFISGKPSTREERWSRLVRSAGQWALMGYGYWAVREAASGRFVGDVGFSDFQREMDPPFGDTPEAGWVLAPWAHGQGFATEAALAAHGWLDAQLKAPRTVCMIDPDNTASIGVARKAGYTEFGRADYKGSAVVLFERKL